MSHCGVSHLEFTCTVLISDCLGKETSADLDFFHKHRTQQNVQKMNTNMQRCDSSEEASAG